MLMDISKKKEMFVYFSINETLSVAYYIKKVIGYGSILKTKKYRLNLIDTDVVVLKKYGGLVKLSRDKLRHEDKINQFNSLI